MPAVKLDVVDAIAAEVESVTAIKTVLVCPPTPIERDAIVLPAAFLFDEDETVTGRNRLEEGRFPQHIEVWAEGVNVRRQMEEIRASIKTALYNSEPLKALSVTINETSVSHFTPEQDVKDEDVVVGLGGVVLLFGVAYLTKWRDPTTQRNY
jgi:hypothetical protein